MASIQLFFFFFFYLIIFIVLTVQEFACSKSYGVNKTTKAKTTNKVKNNTLILPCSRN